MEKKEKLESFFQRNDGEYEPYLNFLKKTVDILDSNFKYVDNFLDKESVDKPYESLTVIFRYGTRDTGFKVILHNKYEQIANKIIFDQVIVQAYGLSNDLKLEIESTRNVDETNFLELRIVGSDLAVQKICELFKKNYKIEPLSREKLKRVLLILDTTIKRKAWYAAEILAKAILKDYPNEPTALNAISIVQNTQKN